MAKSGRYDEIADLVFPLSFHPNRHGEAGAREIVATMYSETEPDAFIRQQTAIMNRRDSRPDLGSIRCPTLVLVGDADVLTPPEHAQEIASGIEGSKLVIVPECGHLSTWDKPEFVTQAMMSWLTGN